MVNWRGAAIDPTSSILDAIKVLEREHTQIVLAVSTDDRLLGTITDGDIRRGILEGVGLKDAVQRVMNVAPRFMRNDDPREGIFAVMRREHLRRIPLVDADGRVTELVGIDDFLDHADKFSIAVIMAGGLGQRLRPLTEEIPKPLIKIGGRPIIERIVENLSAFGFRKLFVAVNYKGEMIEEHLGDGRRFGVEIAYLRETKPLGTAGALALLPAPPDRSFLVLNADLLTQVNLDRLLEFHAEHGSVATVCVREHSTMVPFGVVEVVEHAVVRLEEKPVQRNLVNAGIYVLSPDVLGKIRGEGRIDMTDVLSLLLKEGAPVRAFPIHEYWRDIGMPEDLVLARRDHEGGH